MEHLPSQDGPAFQFHANHIRRIDDLSDSDIQAIIDLALYYARFLSKHAVAPQRLQGRTQINLFFEDSTRTNMSFELAGKKLGADVLNLPVAASSVNKNEDLIDTVQTLAAMGADAMIVRAREDGIHQMLSDHVDCAIINAGDGAREHPTQALLDAITMISEKGPLQSKTIAICGDIRHSRVAGSAAKLFCRLGAEVRFVGPQILMPEDDQFNEIERFDTLKSGLERCDFVMALRMQFERMSDGFSINQEEFYNRYAITKESLGFAKPDAKVMHPGPMNRGIEIDGALADNPDYSLILKQVFYGVATRMAVLDAILNRQRALTARDI